MTVHRYSLVVGAVFGITAVILGAFGAHGLKELLTETSLESYKTGVLYQLVHALYLILLSILAGTMPSATIKWAINFVIVGIVLFSGSIYLLATKDVTGINFSFLGPVTPIGGIFIITSWILLIAEALKRKKV